jgi:hypothetical protein
VLGTNLAPEDSEQLRDYVNDELLQLREHPHLLGSFIEKTRLKLPAEEHVALAAQEPLSYPHVVTPSPPGSMPFHST